MIDSLTGNKLVTKKLAAALLAIAIMYILIYSTFNQSILSSNAYDSYTLQALSWWNRDIALSRDYHWLELAYYKDKIFVSFPPFPSVPMFLLIPFFGEATPSNLITTLYAVSSFIVVYLFCKRKEFSDETSLFWAAFAVFGGNFLSISPFGGVWYQAQALSFLMSLLSIYLILSNNRHHWHWAMACWAFAIGCRPFQIVYFPLFLYIIYYKSTDSERTFLNVLKYLTAPLLIGAAYAVYNYVRFDSLIEFGHNYLPEFTESVYGQFNWRYIFKNLPNLFRLPYYENNRLIFPKFDGFAFYIANPMFIVFFTRLIRDALLKHLNWKNIIILGCFLLHALLFLSHKTLGGWQFGIRYFIDMIPFLLLTIIDSDMKVKLYEIVLCVFGFMFNIYGMLWLNLNW